MADLKREKTTLARAGSKLTRGGSSLSGRNAPDFDSMFDDGDDNPLADIEMTGDTQEDADAGMSEALRQIIERKKATQEKFRTATDPEFFFCVCFQSREQKEEFLKAAGWEDLGDKYLNGLEVARRLAVPVTVIPIEPLKIRGKVNKFTPDDILKRKGGD